MRPYDHGDRISAVFRPVRIDTLRDEVRPFIGRRLSFSYAWTADDDETYAGQAVFTSEDMGGLWVPLEDLAEVEDVVWLPENPAFEEGGEAWKRVPGE